VSFWEKKRNIEIISKHLESNILKNASKRSNFLIIVSILDIIEFILLNTIIVGYCLEAFNIAFQKNKLHFTNVNITIPILTSEVLGCVQTFLNFQSYIAK
jgi:hypothetical protein